MKINLEQQYIDACEQVNRLAETLKERDAEIEQLSTERQQLKAMIWACAGLYAHRTPVTTAFIRELEEISRL